MGALPGTLVGRRGLAGLVPGAPVHARVPRQEVGHRVGDHLHGRRGGGAVEVPVGTLDAIEAGDQQAGPDQRSRGGSASRSWSWSWAASAARRKDTDGGGPRYSALVEERYESELAQSAQVLDDVDRALERLSAGSYATCETCGARDRRRRPRRRPDPSYLCGLLPGAELLRLGLSLSSHDVRWHQREMRCSRARSPKSLSTGSLLGRAPAALN